MERPDRPEDLWEQPDHFGTGLQPQSQKSHFPLKTILLLVLLGANLVSLGILLGMQQGKQSGGWRSTLENSRELILSLKDRLTSRQKEPDYAPAGERLDREDLYGKASVGLTRVVAQTTGYAQTGMGVILTSDGYILTNSHVIEDADALTVTLSDGRERTALYVGADERTDLAVLKIEEENLSQAELASSSQEHQFLYVLTAMKEEALQPASGEDLQTETLQGVIVNESGQIVSIGRENGGPISMEEAGALAYELIHYGCISREDCFGLEVSDLDEVDRRYWNLPEGVVIDQAGMNGSGYLAGLRTGDLITAVNGQPVRNSEEFRRAAEACQGNTVVDFYRKGQEYQAEVRP